MNSAISSSPITIFERSFFAIRNPYQRPRRRPPPGWVSCSAGVRSEPWQRVYPRISADHTPRRDDSGQEPMGGLKAAVTAGCLALLVAGCGSTTQGRAVSPLYDPFRAGGLPAQDGPSGIREDAPALDGTVQGTDGGDADRLATLGVNDVADFWRQNYAAAFTGSFTPIDHLVSYDSGSPSSPQI